MSLSRWIVNNANYICYFTALTITTVDTWSRMQVLVTTAVNTCYSRLENWILSPSAFVYSVAIVITDEWSAALAVTVCHACLLSACMLGEDQGKEHIQIKSWNCLRCLLIAVVLYDTHAEAAWFPSSSGKQKTLCSNVLEFNSLHA